MDASLVVMVSTNGHIPIISGLTLLTHFRMHSWYMTLLSFSVLGLSAGALFYSVNWRNLWLNSWFIQPTTNLYNKGADDLENHICGSGPVLETLSIFCGRDLSGETWYWTFYTPTPIAAWVVCSLWGLYCMFKHATSSGSIEGWNMKYRRF